MSNPVYIYGLVDPRSGRVRYVGRSYRPTARLKEHKKPNSPGRPERFTPKEKWMLELAALGLTPTLRIVAKVGAELAVAQERFWVLHYRDKSPDLLNSTYRAPTRSQCVCGVELSALTCEAEAA